MKVAVIGAGNVGVAIAADLSIKGHEVSLIKTSNTKSEVFEKIQANGNRVFLKENQQYHETTIADHRAEHLSRGRYQETRILPE